MIALTQSQWNGRRVIDNVHQRIHNEMIRLGNRVVATARSLAPIRTGRLRSSIGFDYNAGDFLLVFTVDAPYGVFVEYGTRYMAPYPYLRPALNVSGEIFGYKVEFAFANTPAIHAPIIASGAGFHLPSNLTKKQLRHVRKRLLPISKYLHHGNVSRAPMHIRKG